MDPWIRKFSDASGLSPEFSLGLFQSLTFVAVILALRFVALRIVRNRIVDIKRHYYWRRTINYTAGVFMVLMMAIWFSGLQDLSTFLGLVSAGVAIALSDLLSNLAGWLFILARRPFEVGDRIEISGHFGDVIDIRLFQTYLIECGNWSHSDQSTGRMIAIPNGLIFKHTMGNYTRGFNYIWDEIRVLITFESDWKKAKTILTDIANSKASHMSQGAQEQIREAANKQMIFFQKLTPIVYTDVQDSGVQLTMRFLTPPRQRRSNAHTIWEAILEAFGKEDGIDFAYPTIRHYQNQSEGKSGARAAWPGGTPPDRGSMKS